MHGVVWRVWKGEMEECEVLALRSLRAAVDRTDRIFYDYREWEGLRGRRVVWLRGLM
jgi:hypothetical protein